ncbi:MAG: hypothetical protein AB9842_08215 [Bacteroidales bacterium]
METTAKQSTKKTRKGNVNQETKQEKSKFMVFLDGPFPGFNHDNDEFPYWTIKVSTDLDGDPKYSYRVNNFDKAVSLAGKIAMDQNLEIISSAISA